MSVGSPPAQVNKGGKEVADPLSSGPEDGEIEAGDVHPPRDTCHEQQHAPVDASGGPGRDEAGEPQQGAAGVHESSQAGAVNPINDHLPLQAAEISNAECNRQGAVQQAQASGKGEGAMQQAVSLPDDAKPGPSTAAAGAAAAAVAGAASKGVQGKKRSRELAWLLDADASMTRAAIDVPLDSEPGQSGPSSVPARRGLRGTRSGQ